MAYGHQRPSWQEVRGTGRLGPDRGARTVDAALPTLNPPEGIVSAGYNGLDDIDVVGVRADVLLAALDQQDPAIGARAREAMATGTLRINGEPVLITR